MTAAPARIREQPCFALYTTSRAITKAYRPLLEPLGLTYPQYVVMMALWEQDGLGGRAIAERTELDPATLTPLLRRLEQHGLVARRRAPTDDRRLVVTVTARGRELQRAARHVPDAARCAAGLSAEADAQLRQLCDGIRKTLSDHPD